MARNNAAFRIVALRSVTARPASESGSAVNSVGTLRVYLLRKRSKDVFCKYRAQHRCFGAKLFESSSIGIASATTRILVEDTIIMIDMVPTAGYSTLPWPTEPSTLEGFS
jgi:hypothetical protein